MTSDPNQPPQPPPQPATVQYVVAQQQSTNGLAIASMVLGILWIYWIGSILAVIFGHIALKQTRERGQSGRGMAIAGVTLGWIGVGVLAIVIILVAGASS